MRSRTITLLASLLLVVSACTSSDGNEPTTTTVQAETTTTTAAAVTPSTLEPGSRVELDSVESVRQDDLSDVCAEAVEPIRDMIDTYQSGLEMEGDDFEIFNDSLADGSSVCSPEEWNQFQQLELIGWLNASPSK